MVSLKKILVPTDFSVLSKKAVFDGANLAKKYKAELIIFAVVDDRIFQDGLFDTSYIEQEVLDARNKGFYKRLKSMKEKVLEKEPSLDVRSEMPSGIAYSEIVLFAEKENVDLIVMGTHGSTGIVHILLGSTTEKVIRKAPCPVMVVREKEGANNA